MTEETFRAARTERAERTERAARTVPPVVVGVGADEVSAALAYAAEEAARAGCGIHLVHAAQTIPAGAEEAVASMNVEELGREMLELARKQLATLVADEVPISQELRHGEPVRALVRSATHARMVVLEHHHLSRLARIDLTGAGIASAALAASFAAAAEDRPVELRDVLAAAREELRKLQRPVIESQFRVPDAGATEEDGRSVS